MDIKKIEDSFVTTKDQKCASSKHGMIASAFPNATKAGIEMLQKGGNAIDAACAVALALGVCEPQASGLGGQSMVILRHNGRTIALDGSSRSPSLAHSSKFDKTEHRTIGYSASTVPSTPAVIGYLNEHFGRLPWSTIIKPSIRIAKKGYRITQLQHTVQQKELENFLKIKSRSGAKYFLKDGVVPYDANDLFIQDDLAQTLQQISDEGWRIFYHGSIAKKIADDMKKNSGLLREQDLKLIPEPIERKAIRRHYRNVVIETMPPPSAGRTLLLVLMMLNHFPSKFLRSGEPDSYHFVAETFRKAFLHRLQLPFNPHTYTKHLDKTHLSRHFAKQLADSIHDQMDGTLKMVKPEFGDETTHLSVMDDEGNAVGITQSIELVYGSKSAADGMGFLYNNYISAFEFKNPNHPYFIRPNMIPWTSVSPTFVYHDEKLWMVVGSPGSARIFSTIAHFLSRIIDGDISMTEAVKRPRFHCSASGKISLEIDGFKPEIVEKLKLLGYQIDPRERYSFFHGAIHAVMKCQTRNEFHGVAEVRRDGTAGGLD